jgi:hypothetical protein
MKGPYKVVHGTMPHHRKKTTSFFDETGKLDPERQVSFVGPFITWREEDDVMAINADGEVIRLPGQHVQTLEQVLENHAYPNSEDAIFEPGQYHPRMFRAGPIEAQVSQYGSAWISSTTAAAPLFERLANVMRIIEPVRAHKSTYGHELRHLLILVCTEIENAWKEILIANDYDAEPGWTEKDKRARSEVWRSKQYAELAEPLRLDQWILRLSTAPLWEEIRPFKGWDIERATKSLRWYSANQQTKHTREMALDQATLRNVIRACGALWVMIASQFGEDPLKVAPFDMFMAMQRPEWRLGERYFPNRLRPEWSKRPYWRKTTVGI